MGVATVTEVKQSVTGKRMLRPSLSTGHAENWSLTEVPSDVTVEVGTASFDLHKFPLVSRSGKIRKLIADAKDSKMSRITLHATPGGAEAFELAAKFCYGLNIEITLKSVAMLRCTAHYLLMTEEFSEKNLELRAEAYLKDAVLQNINSSISVLHCCETLLPIAEEIHLVNKLITAIVTSVCKEQLTSGLAKLEHSPSVKSVKLESEPISEWWGKSLAVLSLEFFQRVLSTAKIKGLKQETVSRILILYAQKSLQGLIMRDRNSSKASSSDAEMMKKHRIVVEAIVSLLPTQSRKSPVPIAFLSGLMKAAITTSASSICRADLERRIGLQLDQATLEDILIPTNPQSSNHYQLYDTVSIARIFSIFLNMDEKEDEGLQMTEVEDGYGYDSSRSPKQSLILKVSKLLDSYLAEIALDSNLTPSKFITLAELLPDHARVVNDGLYRAVDIFLKVHPNIKESERYGLCKAIDCQKLSQEACSHAAQNERLPVQMAVQVLYFEQIRLRNAMNSGISGSCSHDPTFFFGPANTNNYLQFPQRSSSGVGSGAVSPRDNYASVRRENRELKLEVARMRMRLTELEKDHVSMKRELIVRSSNPAQSLFRSFARTLGKLNTLFRMKEQFRPVQHHSKATTAEAGIDARFTLFHRRRRNSIS